MIVGLHNISKLGCGKVEIFHVLLYCILSLTYPSEMSQFTADSVQSFITIWGNMSMTALDWSPDYVHSLFHQQDIG